MPLVWLALVVVGAILHSDVDATSYEEQGWPSSQPPPTQLSTEHWSSSQPSEQPSLFQSPHSWMLAPRLTRSRSAPSGARPDEALLMEELQIEADDDDPVVAEDPDIQSTSPSLARRSDTNKLSAEPVLLAAQMQRLPWVASHESSANEVQATRSAGSQYEARGSEYHDGDSGKLRFLQAAPALPTFVMPPLKKQPPRAALLYAPKAALQHGREQRGGPVAPPADQLTQAAIVDCHSVNECKQRALKHAAAANHAGAKAAVVAIPFEASQWRKIAAREKAAAAVDMLHSHQAGLQTGDSQPTAYAPSESVAANDQVSVRQNARQQAVAVFQKRQVAMKEAVEKDAQRAIVQATSAARSTPMPPVDPPVQKQPATKQLQQRQAKKQQQAQAQQQQQAKNQQQQATKQQQQQRAKKHRQQDDGKMHAEVAAKYHESLEARLHAQAAATPQHDESPKERLEKQERQMQTAHAETQQMAHTSRVGALTPPAERLQKQNKQVKMVHAQAQWRQVLRKGAQIPASQSQAEPPAWAMPPPASTGSSLEKRREAFQKREANVRSQKQAELAKRTQADLVKRTQELSLKNQRLKAQVQEARRKQQHVQASAKTYASKLGQQLKASSSKAKQQFKASSKQGQKEQKQAANASPVSQTAEAVVKAGWRVSTHVQQPSEAVRSPAKTPEISKQAYPSSLAKPGIGLSTSERSFRVYMQQFWDTYPDWLRVSYPSLYTSLLESKALETPAHQELWQGFLSNWRYTKLREPLGFRFSWNPDGTFNVLRYQVLGCRRYLGHSQPGDHGRRWRVGDTSQTTSCQGAMSRNVFAASVHSTNNLCYPGVSNKEAKLHTPALDNLVRAPQEQHSTRAEVCNADKRVSTRLALFQLSIPKRQQASGLLNGLNGAPTMHMMRAYRDINMKEFATPWQDFLPQESERLVGDQRISWRINLIQEYCERPLQDGTAAPFDESKSWPRKTTETGKLRWLPIRVSRLPQTSDRVASTLLELTTEDHRLGISCHTPEEKGLIEGRVLTPTDTKCDIKIKHWPYSLRCPDDKVRGLALVTSVLLRYDDGEPAVEPSADGEANLVRVNRKKMTLRFQKKAMLQLQGDSLDNPGEQHPVSMRLKVSEPHWIPSNKYQSHRHYQFSLGLSSNEIDRLAAGMLTWDPLLSSHFRHESGKEKPQRLRATTDGMSFMQQQEKSAAARIFPGLSISALAVVIVALGYLLFDSR